jgi:hypothetical protein
VTGSGQTKATADRVHIFEVEGGITMNHRNGRSKQKRANPQPSSHNKTTKRKLMPKSMRPVVEDEPTTLTKRQRTGEQHSRQAGTPLAIYENPLNASKYMSHLAHLRAQARHQDGSESTDVDEDSETEELKTVAVKAVTHPKESIPMSVLPVMTHTAPVQSQPNSATVKDGIGSFQLFRNSSLEADAQLNSVATAAPALRRNVSMSQRLGTYAPVVVNDQFLRTFDYLDNIYAAASANGSKSSINTVNDEDLFSDMEWFELLAICQ